MFYNLGIYSYGILLKIAALFHPKAKKWVEGRKDFWKNLPDVKNKNVIWFHCASLGEYDQGKPIMEEWKKKNPTDFILITFFSPSGYENVYKKSIGDFTYYLPLDTPQNARKFISYFQPKTTFFVKYEIWINYLKEAKKNKSDLYLISAVFRENHRFFKWYGKSFLKTLFLFDKIFVQTENAKQIAEKNGLKNILLSGDTRFDRVYQRTLENKRNEIIEPWTKDDDVLVIGSSWEEDEAILIPLINDFKIQNPIILAPHEVGEKHIQEIVGKLRVSYQLYTNLQKGEELKPATLVLILDCIGVLADAYRYGRIAYVGGAFRTGLHNILEPAAFGLPVIFGPNYKRFPEAQEFINAGIGKSCHDSDTFRIAYSHFEKQEGIRNKVKQFVETKKGATEIVMKNIRS